MPEHQPVGQPSPGVPAVRLADERGRELGLRRGRRHEHGDNQGCRQGESHPTTLSFVNASQAAAAPPRTGRFDHGCSRHQSIPDPKGRVLTPDFRAFDLLRFRSGLIGAGALGSAETKCSAGALTAFTLVFRIQSDVNICHGILREGIHGQPCTSHHGPRRGSA